MFLYMKNMFLYMKNMFLYMKNMFLYMKNMQKHKICYYTYKMFSRCLYGNY
ncbi:hypothetical protein LmYK1_21670 (plasmid) [Ligilactobacillus murinus]|nr:hypothetical protein LmYK1_21670 [Ligilactobacillus murinus]